jgi:hypothetical protein
MCVLLTDTPRVCPLAWYGCGTWPEAKHGVCGILGARELLLLVETWAVHILYLYAVRT